MRVAFLVWAIFVVACVGHAAAGISDWLGVDRAYSPLILGPAVTGAILTLIKAVPDCSAKDGGGG